MKPRPLPQWMQRAREMAAKVSSPVGAPFAAKKSGSAAKLYLYAPIGHDEFWQPDGIAATDVVAALAEVKGADTLEVHINSPGGFVFDGISIFNAIRSFDGKKTVCVDGLAASIASIIALAGDTVITNEGAMWMIHEPASGVLSMGTADEIEADARKTVTALRKMHENLVGIYQSATGQAVSDISAWMAAETWMTAAEAKARGFTDEVVTSSDTGCDCGCDCGCATGVCDCSGNCGCTCTPENCDCTCPCAQDATARAVPRKTASAVSPRVMADMARAQARSLSERFAAASRSDHPGQPGSKPHTSTRSTR